VSQHIHHKVALPRTRAPQKVPERTENEREGEGRWEERRGEERGRGLWIGKLNLVGRGWRLVRPAQQRSTLVEQRNYTTTERSVLFCDVIVIAIIIIIIIT